MSPLLELLSKRQIFFDDDCDENGRNCNDRSSWNEWGRWVALVVIIVFFIVVGFMASLLANRRRRRLGRNPVPGTGWMPYAGHPGFYPPPAYGEHNQPQNNYSPETGASYGPSPPKYPGPMDNQQTGTTVTGQPGYYGQGQDIELQQPSPSYQQSTPVANGTYSPPPGPPPMRDEKL